MSQVAPIRFVPKDDNSLGIYGDIAALVGLTAIGRFDATATALRDRDEGDCKLSVYA